MKLTSIGKKELCTRTVLLLIGIGIGWGWGEYRSRCMLDHLRQTWSPEFQEFITESVRVGDILNEISTEDEMREIMSLSKKTYSNWNSQAIGKAFYSLNIKKMLKAGEVENAISFSESRLEVFLERYDAGSFKGDINEEAAEKLANMIKNNRKIEIRNVHNRSKDDDPDDPLSDLPKPLEPNDDKKKE